MHDASAFLSDSSSASKCSMIVPVYVSHSSNPCKERLVYALLDTQSDTTFILEDTCTALGLTGASVQLSLSTMHAENKVVHSTKIRDLLVRGLDADNSIPLPVAYTRNIMLANRSHIPCPDIAELWSHLKPIVSQLAPLNQCEIGLLT